MIDAGLALAVAVIIDLDPRVAAAEDSPDVLACALGLTIAALALVRRRWPVAVLVTSAAILHVYYLLDYQASAPPCPCGGAGRRLGRGLALVAPWSSPGSPGAPSTLTELVDPDPRPDHAQAVAEMAMAIRDEVARRTDPVVSRWRSASASTPTRWWPG